jgi:hypothetical protein
VIDGVVARDEKQSRTPSLSKASSSFCLLVYSNQHYRSSSKSLHKAKMNEQFLPLNTGDESSQQSGSLPRATSLLERIQAQREREAAIERSNSANNSAELNAGGYVPPLTDGGAGSPSLGRVSMNFEDDLNPVEFSQGLLSGQNRHIQNEYSMKEYFLTFVMDMYAIFRSIPVPAQAILVLFLLWVVWKLI